MAAAGPAAAAWAVARRRAAYRRAVERGLPEVATAVADALSVGRSARAALAAAAASLEGPPAREMARVRAELALGAPTRAALEELRRRLDSPRVDSFAAALLSQQLAGGDLATLLRRFAAAAADRDRTEADARSATAQARFTGLLVVAMPVGAALLAELLSPGFVGGMLANPAAADPARRGRGASAGRLRGDQAPEPGGLRMTTAALAAIAVLLAFGAAWELAAVAGEPLRAAARSALVSVSAGRAGSLAELGERLGLGGRIERAGLGSRLGPRSVVAAKLAGAGCRRPGRVRRGTGRSGPARDPGRARLRRRRLLGARRAARARGATAPQAASSPRSPTRSTCSPSGAASGRDPATGLGEIAGGTERPARGRARARRRRDRVRQAAARGDRRAARARPGRGGRAPWRPRSSGRGPTARRSPSSCTCRRRRCVATPAARIEERAARAAPKIQLVVALVLVPVGAADDRRRDRRSLRRPARKPSLRIRTQPPRRE